MSNGYRLEVERADGTVEVTGTAGALKAQRIRDAEAAVIAAAERVVEGWHYVNHGKQLEPSRIEREADLTTAVRALLEARK